MSNDQGGANAPTEDQGASSQDRPGGEEPSGSAGDAGRKTHDPTRPEDSNEKADERASVVEPD